MSKTRNIVNEIDHGLDKPLTGGFSIMKDLYEDLRYEQGHAKKTRTKKLSSSSKEGMIILTSVLALLRAMHWSHWTTHWQVKADPFYGDHLLFQRLYEGLVDDIDTLAEKVVAFYGAEAVKAVVQIDISKAFLEIAPKDGCPIKKGMFLEDLLQRVLKAAYKALKDSGDLTLGLDDYLMALANKHETNVYLIKRRLEGRDSK
jgi:DNA-binding ferritin-like protein